MKWLILRRFQAVKDLPMHILGLKLLPKKADQSDTRILVGLDGGIKSSGLSVQNSGLIFRIIDAMPMRMSEFVKKKNQENSLNK